MMDKICEHLPNCGKALELVESACERELGLWEKVRLRYHGRLCPFCGCAAGKYESARNRMRLARECREGSTKPSMIP